MPGILIQCVVVLYKQSPHQSQSLSALLRLCSDDPSLAAKISITVHDNSPQSQFTPGYRSAVEFDYFHAPSNPGLAVAYNRALSMARKGDIPWLLTLDQDTAVDRNFLLSLLAAVESGFPENVCALVPQLVADGIVLSPQTVGKVFYHRIPLGFSGFLDRPLLAFNSAACLKVQALVAMDGFPEEFWLDYLDHMVFHRLQAAGGRVYILPSQLAHSLSMQTMESHVSIDRYANLLAAEWRFVRESSSPTGRLIHRIRLLKRSSFHGAQVKNKTYALLTLRAAFKVRFPRAQRSRS